MSNSTESAFAPSSRTCRSWRRRCRAKYEILGPLTGPNFSTGWVRTIWIILTGETAPRLAALIPAESHEPCPLQRVVLTRDLPEEGLRPVDVGVIVENYPARADAREGYELESFAATGQTIAVVSVPASAIREATEHEVLSVTVPQLSLFWVRIRL